MVAKRKRLTKAEGMYKAKTGKWGSKKLFIVDVNAVMRNAYVPSLNGEDLFASGSKARNSWADPRIREINGEEVNTSALKGLYKLFDRYGTDADYIFCYSMIKGTKERMESSFKRGYVTEGNEYYQQINTSYMMLKECGFKVLGEENVSSKLMIYKAVVDNYSKYDKIGIITNDHSLAYLISKKVEWLNVAVTKTDICEENYPLILKCPYNTILLKYAMVGYDSVFLKVKGIHQFGEGKFLKFLDSEGIYGQDILWEEEDIIKNSTSLSEAQKAQAIDCLLELYPYEVELSGVISTSVNSRRVKTYMKKYGMDEFIGLWGTKI